MTEPYRVKFGELSWRPPDGMKDGVVYVNFGRTLCTYKCPCGCGNNVRLPLGGKGWTLTVRGDLPTLNPSVHSVSWPCSAHYVMTDGRIEWK